MSQRMRFEFRLDGGWIALHDSPESPGNAGRPEVRSAARTLKRAVKLVEQRKRKQALALLGPLSFYFDLKCMPAHYRPNYYPGKVFVNPTNFEFPLTGKNSTVRLEASNGALKLNAAVQFGLDVKSGLTHGDVQEWLEKENASFLSFVNFHSADWHIAGDDGIDLSVVRPVKSRSRKTA